LHCLESEVEDTLSLQKIEVKFIYLVETSTKSLAFLGSLENIILNELAESILTCADNLSEKEYVYRKLGNSYKVIQIEFPPTNASNISPCKPMNEESKSCSIISSEVVISSDGPYSFEAKYDTLAELKGMINSATRLSFQIPELTVTHFLGPDITSFNQDAHNAPLSSKQSRVTAGNAVLFILLAIFSIIIGIIFFWQRKSTQRQHVDTYNRVEDVGMQ